MKEILKLDHIQKYYGNSGNVTKAIQDISFSVQEGEFVGIMGASGSGKTTLLNCISTIDTAVSYTHLDVYKRQVMKLPEKQAKRSYARYYLGMTVNEIAEVEGVDPSRVRDSIRRGLKQLGKYF